MTRSDRDILRGLLAHYRLQVRNNLLGRQLRNQARAAVEALVILEARLRSGRDLNRLYETEKKTVPSTPRPPTPVPRETRLKVIQGGKA